MSDSQTEDTTVRASHWSITINNPTEDDRNRLRTKQRWLRRVKWQDEVGEKTRTLHLQIYANTDQIRASAIREWLPGCHMKPVWTKEHLKNVVEYVEKEHTGVPGTKQDIVYRSKEAKPITMANMLTSLAQFAYSAEYIREQTTPTETQMKVPKLKEVYEKEYWHCVTLACGQDPDLIQTYSMPCYKIAWVNTRPVWVQKYLVDSQTNIEVVENISDTSIDGLSTSPSPAQESE